MEIVLKNVNFESVAVKKIGTGYEANISGYADTAGDLQSSSSNTRTEVIPISASMRSGGFVVLGSRHWTNNPAVVFYNSDQASQSTYVDVYTDTNYNEHNIYVSPSDIPAGATHFIANGYKDNELTVWENFLDDVTSDYAFTDGYLDSSNTYVADPDWRCSKIVPIDNSLVYYYNYNRCATYDANLNFIRLIQPRDLVSTGGFNSNEFYARICGLKTNGTPYLKY